MAIRDINEPKHAFRFLDVDEEPLKTFLPILNYEYTPLVSVDKAIVPLEFIIPYIKNMVEIVKMNSSQLEDGLTRDESNSIRLYTLEWQPRECSLFYLLNRALRSQNRQQLEPWLPFLRLILTALSRLPSTSLIVYRGINMDLARQYPMGATFVWHGFSSCMKKTTKLENKLFLNKTGNRTLFVINSHSGKNISQHSTYESEGEVILLPARQFTVVSSVNKGKGLHIIELNEIQPAFNFSNTISTSPTISAHCSILNTQFRPISTISLSKKAIPATLLNLRLEERLAHSFKQRFNVDLANINLNDSDMDTIVNEIIIYRQCHELDLSNNNFTYRSISLLAQILPKNKVRKHFSYCTSVVLMSISIILTLMYLNRNN